MRWTDSKAPLAAAALVVAVWGGAVVPAQQAPAAGQPQGRGAGGTGRGTTPGALFGAFDGNRDAAVTREEMKAALEKWHADAAKTGTAGASQDQLAEPLATALLQIPPCGGRSQNRFEPCAKDVEAMRAALPDTPPAKPQKPRRILSLGHAAGFVHSSIPLAARTIEELGEKTGAWRATTTYDPADINAENLKQYDALFLVSTTGEFLDDPKDPAVTASRRSALLEFVRSGKGLAAIHAATDSYHGNPKGGGGRAMSNDPVAAAKEDAARAARTMARVIVTHGDKNGDGNVSREELTPLADSWFDQIDPGKAGRLNKRDFDRAFAAFMPAPAQREGAGGRGPYVNAALWPEFNRMIGGWFKHHWNDPQLIVVKIDDPKSPINAPFNGKPFEIRDETYTFPMESWSRQNVHVLTSVDYSKMSEEDKAHEPASSRRTDGDYGLCWIRREGKGRVFYEAHGHHERVYAIRPMLEHILAGVQYALGDLQADDSPSVKGGTR